MLLTHWNRNASTPFHALSRELERMFDGFAEAPNGRRAKHVAPPLSISETEDGFDDSSRCRVDPKDANGVTVEPVAR